MFQEGLFHSCVGKLYEMALEPQGWGAFLDDFCTLVDAAFAHCVAWDERSDATVFSASSRAIPTGSEQAYIEHYGTIDPQRKFITERADGKWVLCHEQFDERYVSQSEFYQDFLIPVGGRYVAITNLGVVDGVMLGLGLHRGRDREPFGPREAVWPERIKPHLQRAARLHMEVWQLRLQASLAEYALDALQYPVMVVDEHARVQLASVAAQRWLAENGQVASSSGRLTGLHAGFEQRLSSDHCRDAQRRRSADSSRARGAAQTIDTEWLLEAVLDPRHSPAPRCTPRGVLAAASRAPPGRARQARSVTRESSGCLSYRSSERVMTRLGVR